MSDPVVSVIIVSYNTMQMTLECIQSVFDETSKYPFEILVLDNQSSDGSADAIAKQFPDITLVRSEENLGFARANNVLIESVKTPYVLLLNPDTVVLDGAIDKLMDFAQSNPVAGIWGGRTLFGDHQLNPGSCFRKMSPWNQFCRASGIAAIFKNSEFFNSENFGGWQRDTVREVDIVCGCFLLITTELWNQLGGFNKKYFMYAEEADLCLRAKKLGAKPAVTPEAEIIHYGGGSEKVRADKMIRLLKAKITLAKDHWQGWQRPLASPLLASWVLTRYIALFAWCSLKKSDQKRTDALNSWKTIWTRRNEWIDGAN